MTTVVVPRGIAHLAQVVAPASGAYRAECHCGWAGGWTDDEAQAVAASRDHRMGGRAPRRSVDQLLADLLDLQDDLADAACWLAESWPGDLPVPDLWPRADLRGGPPPTGVSLLVRCVSRVEVARVAHAMGVPVEPGPEAGRGLRAVRRFGRVRVEASTAPTCTPG